MVYAAILPGPLPEQFAPQLSAYRNRPLGSLVTNAVPVGAAKGEPGMGVNTPLFVTLNPLTLPGITSATLAHRPGGTTGTEFGEPPAENGEPGTASSLPFG